MAEHNNDDIFKVFNQNPGHPKGSNPGDKKLKFDSHVGHDFLESPMHIWHTQEHAKHKPIDYHQMGKSMQESFNNLQAANPNINLHSEEQEMQSLGEKLSQVLSGTEFGTQELSEAMAAYKEAMTQTEQPFSDMSTSEKISSYHQPEVTLETTYEPLTALEKTKLNAAIAEVRWTYDVIGEHEQAAREIVGIGRKVLPYLKTQLISDDMSSSLDATHFSHFIGAMAEVDDAKLVLDTLKNEHVIGDYDGEATANLAKALQRMIYEIRTNDPSDKRLQLISNELEKIRKLKIGSFYAQEEIDLTFAMTGTDAAKKQLDDSYLYKFAVSLSTLDTSQLQKKLFEWQKEDALFQSEDPGAHEIDPETGLTKSERAAIDQYLKKSTGYYSFEPSPAIVKGEKAIVAIGSRVLPYLKDKLLNTSGHEDPRKFVDFAVAIAEPSDVEMMVDLLQQPEIRMRHSSSEVLLHTINRSIYAIRRDNPEDERLQEISTKLHGYLTDPSDSSYNSDSYFTVLSALAMTGTDEARGFIREKFKDESDVDPDFQLLLFDYLKSVKNIDYSNIRKQLVFSWQDTDDPYEKDFRDRNILVPLEGIPMHEYQDTLTEKQRRELEVYVQFIIRDDSIYAVNEAKERINAVGRVALPFLKKMLIDSQPDGKIAKSRVEQFRNVAIRLAEEDDAPILLDLMKLQPEDQSGKVRETLNRLIYDIRLGDPSDKRLSVISRDLIAQIKAQDRPSLSYLLLTPLALTGTQEAKAFLSQIDFFPQSLLTAPRSYADSLADVPTTLVSYHAHRANKEKIKMIHRKESDSTYDAWIRKHESNGQLEYIRFYHDADQARLHYLTDRLYRRLGVQVPDSELHEIDGQLAYISSRVPGLGRHPKPDALIELQSGFVLDAFLGNADVLGKKAQHIEKRADGKLYRMDNSHSLTRSSQGFNKDVIMELSSMRFAGLNPEAAAVFGGITDDQLRAQAEQLIHRLRPKDIERIVASAGLSDTLAKTMTSSLLGRRKYLMQRFGLSERQNGSRLQEAILKKTERVMQRLSEQSAAEQLKARFATASFLGDSNKIEGHHVDVIERKYKPEFGAEAVTKIVASFKVTDWMYKMLLNETIHDIPENQRTKTPFQFVFPDGYTKDLCKAWEIPCDDETKIYIADAVDGNYGYIYHALLGAVNIEVSGATDVEELAERMQEAFSVLGISEGLVDPDSEAEQQYKENRFRWHHRLEDPEKYKAYQDHLAQQGIPDILAHLTREEVFPEYYTIVDHGASERYAQDGPYFLYRTNSSAENLPSVFRQGLLASSERFRRGMNIHGMSTIDDFKRGGADSVFLRLATPAMSDNRFNIRTMDCYLLVVNQQVLDRTDWYAYNTDEYGSTEPEYLHTRPSPEDYINSQRSRHVANNELMVRRGIPPEMIQCIITGSEEYRLKAIEELKKSGIHEINGVPVEHFVRINQGINTVFAEFGGGQTQQ